jgi:hypothetical protein
VVWGGALVAQLYDMQVITVVAPACSCMYYSHRLTEALNATSLCSKHRDRRCRERSLMAEGKVQAEITYCVP